MDMDYFRTQQAMNLAIISEELINVRLSIVFNITKINQKTMKISEEQEALFRDQRKHYQARWSLMHAHRKVVDCQWKCHLLNKGSTSYSEEEQVLVAKRQLSEAVEQSMTTKQQILKRQVKLFEALNALSDILDEIIAEEVHITEKFHEHSIFFARFDLLNTREDNVFRLFQASFRALNEFYILTVDYCLAVRNFCGKQQHHCDTVRKFCSTSRELCCSHLLGSMLKSSCFLSQEPKGPLHEQLLNALQQVTSTQQLILDRNRAVSEIIPVLVDYRRRILTLRQNRPHASDIAHMFFGELYEVLEAPQTLFFALQNCFRTLDNL